MTLVGIDVPGASHLGDFFLHIIDVESISSGEVAAEVRSIVGCHDLTDGCGRVVLLHVKRVHLKDLVTNGLKFLGQLKVPRRRSLTRKSSP